MSEPTDHRAEAEAWLGRADNTGLTSEALKAALIAIGHALLAGPPAHTVNVPNYFRSREELRKALIDMARQGQLAEVVRSSALHGTVPPVSTSEG